MILSAAEAESADKHPAEITIDRNSLCTLIEYKFFIVCCMLLEFLDKIKGSILDTN